MGGHSLQEQERLEALHALQILDTPPDPQFDRLTRQVVDLLDVPFALLSIVDETRQWWKSAIGLEPGGSSERKHAFCHHALNDDGLFVVEDACEDFRFKENPFVTDEPHIRFYAGVPLKPDGRNAVGTLCAIDIVPRTLSAREMEVMTTLGEIASDALNAHRNARSLSRLVEREQAAAAQVREAEAQLRSTLSALSEGIVMQDREGAIVLANPAAEEILGLSMDQLRGLTSVDPRWKSIREDGSDFPGTEHPSMVSLRTGEPQRDKIMGIHKPDGTETWISINTELVYDEDRPTPRAVVASFQDITNRRQSDIQLRVQSDQIKRFAYLASHDIQEPLRKIALFADMVQEDLSEGDPEEVLKYVEIIKSSALSGSRLVHDILRFSSLSASGLERSRFGPAALCKEAFENLPDNDATLACDIGISSLHGDEKLLKQCFSNILANSIKYARKDVAAHIEVTSDFDPASRIHAIRFKDNGIGFPAEYGESIFEAFKRLVPKHQFEGSGIGLSFVRSVILDHGWQIEAVGQPDVGTIITIRIPDRDTGRSLS